MTTDTKAVARFDLWGFDGFMEPQEHGDYVLFTDHEQVVAELRNVAQVMLDSSSAEIIRLRAELAVKSKDAARYVWLRDHAPEEWDVTRHLDDEHLEVHIQDYLDEAIDSAMGEGNGR